MDTWPGISDWNGLEVIGHGPLRAARLVRPAHPHGLRRPRDSEFVDRIKGLTYQEIAAKGGGILNSARRCRRWTRTPSSPAQGPAGGDDAPGHGGRGDRDGYSLSVESELKMLRVVKRLKEALPLQVKATLLAAHACPKNSRTGAAPTWT